MAEYNPSKIIKDGNTYNFRDTTKIPLAGSNAISGDLIPATDNSIDIGSSTKNIKALYTKGITIDGKQFLPSDYIPETGSNQISGDLIPSTDNTIDIGSSSKKIKSVFANYLNNINLSTLFDISNAGYIANLNNSALQVAGKVVVCFYNGATSNNPTPQASGTCFTLANLDNSNFGIQIALSNKGIYARRIHESQYGAWGTIFS